VARARFERIVALREGRLVFDLPAAEVTDELLRALYADHEDELTPDLAGAAGWADEPPVATGQPAVAATCR